MDLFKKVMPADDYSRKIMDERAVLLAHEIVDTVTIEETMVNYIRFKLGAGETYGIPYGEIQDVITVHAITSVPMTPDFVLGVIYWHGKLISVVDLAKYFSIPATTKESTHHLIATVKHDKAIIGFKFNDVAGVDAYQHETLDKNLAMNTHIKEKYIYGIHHGRVTILNIKEVAHDLATELMKQKGA